MVSKNKVNVKSKFYTVKNTQSTIGGLDTLAEQDQKPSNQVLRCV